MATKDCLALEEEWALKRWKAEMEEMAAMRREPMKPQMRAPPICSQNLVYMLQSFIHPKCFAPVIARLEACVAAASAPKVTYATIYFTISNTPKPPPHKSEMSPVILHYMKYLSCSFCGSRHKLCYMRDCGTS